MLAAQTALFEQDHKGEPLLGAWLPQSTASGAALRSPIVNVPNAGYPGPIPNFDRAVFRTFASREAAEQALAAGEIDVILDANRVSMDPSSSVLLSPTRSMRFILFNLDAEGVDDPAIRRALTCMIDQAALAGALPGGGVPRAAFVAPEDEYWSDRGGGPSVRGPGCSLAPCAAPHSCSATRAMRGIRSR